jgi:glycosyltransferase involved in cell wall biosynthesis
MKGGQLIAQARRAGFTVYECNFRRLGWLFCLVRLLWVIRRHRIEIVNTHSSLDAWIGGIAARLARVAVIRTRHLSTPIKPGWNSRFLYGTLADFVVTTCASIVPMISEQSGKPLALCRSIPTGVDPEKIACDVARMHQFRDRLGIQSSDFLVGTACSMRSWKGIDDLLEAAHRLRHVSEIRWIIIGGGHAEKHWKKAKDLQLDGIVHFTGHLDNPFPALAALDVFALLSTAHEGVSQAILQAAFLEKALISTPVGGLGEVCIDRKTGLQVAPFCSADVAQAVLTLKENPVLRKQLAQGAYQRVQERFLFRQTLDQMEDVYQLIVGKSGPL